MYIKDMVKKCAQCGKEFTSTHKERIFCSRLCYFKSKIGILRKSVQLACEHCGLCFVISNYLAKNRRFCSVKCSRLAMQGDKAANWKGGADSKICFQCGDTFFVKKSYVSSGRGQFCSKKCFDLSRMKRTSVPCPTCGVIREIRDSDIKRGRFFCNQKCYRLHHPTSIESKIRDYLFQKGIYFIPEHNIGRWSIDIFIPQFSLAIECDGEYWHRNTQERDARKDAFLFKKGITVLRLSENNIRNNMQYCQTIIDSHIKQ